MSVSQCGEFASLVRVSIHDVPRMFGRNFRNLGAKLSQAFQLNFLLVYKKRKEVMTDLKISRAQYAQLIKSIEKALRSNISGGGGGFAPPDTIPYIHDIGFFVQDDRFLEGGFFSTIGNAFKKVYSALKNSGFIDKAKDVALKKGREMGGKAIDAAAKKIDAEASKRGLDVSKITQAAASKAHEHLHEAEGFVQKKLDEGQRSLEKKAGVSGSGMYSMHGKGHGYHGSGLYEMGGTGRTVKPAPKGTAYYESDWAGLSGKGDAFAPQQFIRAPTSYGIPDGAMEVSATHHLFGMH